MNVRMRDRLAQELVAFLGLNRDRLHHIAELASQRAIYFTRIDGSPEIYTSGMRYVVLAFEYRAVRLSTSWNEKYIEIESGWFDSETHSGPHWTGKTVKVPSSTQDVASVVAKVLTGPL